MSLKTVYQPYFRMGAAVPAHVFESAIACGELCAQYDSMTCENEMKPQFLLDEGKTGGMRRSMTAVPLYVLTAYGNIWILPGSMA